MNQDLSVDNTVLFESPRARARFVSAKEQAKDFIKKNVNTAVLIFLA